MAIPARGREVLEAYRRGVGREAHLLAGAPDRMWQQLHNRLQWEGDLVEARLAPERDGRSSPGASPWFRMRSPPSESAGLIGSVPAGGEELAFTRDGLLVTVGGGVLRSWDPATGIPVRAVVLTDGRGEHASTTGLVVSPDGSFLVSATEEAVKLWDLETGVELRTLEGARPGAIPEDADMLVLGRLLMAGTAGPIGLPYAVGPDGSFVAGSGEDGTLRIWDAGTGRVVRMFDGHTGPITACAAGPDGSLVVSADPDGTLLLWDPARGSLGALGSAGGGERSERSLRRRDDADPGEDPSLALGRMMARGRHEAELGEARHVWGCAVAPDGSFVVAVSGARVTVWDLPDRTVRWTRQHFGDIRGCAVSPDGTFIVSAGERRVLRLWDPDTGEIVSTLTGHADPVYACAVSPDGSVVGSGGKDGLRLWHAGSRDGRESLEGHADRVTSCTFSPDGRWVASTGADDKVILWDAGTRQPIRSLEGHDDVVQDAAFTPDGSRVVTAGRDNTARVWDPATAEHLVVLAAGEPVWGCAVSPDGTSVLLGSGERPTLWDLETAERVLELGPHQGEVWRCAFAPDGSWAVTSSKDGTLRIWDTASGQERASLAGHEGLVGVCAVSPDGTFVVSGGEDRTVRLWDVDEPGQRHLLEGHTAAVWGCAVSPDARYVLTGSWDRTLRVWNADSGRQEMCLRLPVGVHGVGFHPARLLAAFGDLTGWIHLVELVGLGAGPAVVTPRETEGGLSFTCPACGEVCPMAEDVLGESLSCPRCGAALRLTGSPVRPRARAGSGPDAGGPSGVHQILGQPVSPERELMHSLKSCNECGNEYELLRYACPRCGSPTGSPASYEAVEFMQMRQERAGGLVDRGSQLFQRGLYDDAEAEFLKAIEANPWNATAHANIGVVMLRRDRLEEAIAWFEKALVIDPEVEGVRDMVARKKAELAARGGPVLAASAPEEEQGSVQEEVAAGQAAMWAQDWEEAIRHYGVAIRLVEGGASSGPVPVATIYGERATAHAHNGDYRSALTDYDAALEREPNEAHYLDSRARVHQVTGHPDLAVEGYTRALALLPPTGDRAAGVLLFRAASYRDLGQRDRALEDLRRAEEMCHDPTLRQRIEQLSVDVRSG